MDERKNNKSWTKNNGRTVSATTDLESGKMTTTGWPRNATSKDELNNDQIEVIKKAVTHPSIDNIAALNRRCEYETYHADTYAYQVLEQHWPERLESQFNEEDINMVTETAADNDTEIGGISINSNENNDAGEITTENITTDSKEVEWPEEVTRKEKLNDSQIKVIKAAITNPDVESTGKLTEKAGVADSHNQYYAYDVLEAHWPQMLDAILNDEESKNNEQENTDENNTETVDAKNNTNTDELENEKADKIVNQTTLSNEPDSEPDTEKQDSPTVHQSPPEQTTNNSYNDTSNSLKVIGAFIAGFIFAYRLLKNRSTEK